MAAPQRSKELAAGIENLAKNLVAFMDDLRDTGAAGLLQKDAGPKLKNIRRVRSYYG